MLADLAVIDPDLTLTVPPAVTAATGVDALAHCVEAFTSRKAHPTIDLYALEGIRLVGRYLARAVADGGDREARAGMALASLYGGICLGPVNTDGRPCRRLPARYASPRCARRRLRADLPAHAGLQRSGCTGTDRRDRCTALGLPAATEAAAVFDAAYGYCAALGFEMRLSRLGVPEDDLPRMAEEAHAIRRLLDNNPRDIGRDDILSMYRAAY